MRSKTKFLLTILFVLGAFVLLGSTNVYAETIHVETTASLEYGYNTVNDMVVDLKSENYPDFTASLAANFEGDLSWCTTSVQDNVTSYTNIIVTPKTGLEVGQYSMSIGLRTDWFGGDIYEFEISLTVVPKSLKISGITDNQQFAYDGNVKSPLGILSIENDLYKVADLKVLYEGTGNTIYSSANAPSEVGTYKVTYSIDDKNYTGSVAYNFSVMQGTPAIDIPTDLTGVKGQKLSDVALPEGFTWENADTNLELGKHKYKATYTPTNKNYKTVNGVEIEVCTKDVFDITAKVNGEGGKITTSKTSAVENEKVKFIFTPDTGYMIDKVLANGAETPITNNELELAINKNTTVEVTFKKIVYNVLEGANQTYTISKSSELRIRIDADYSLFAGKVYVDGNLIGEENYTSESGSTIITLKQSYIETLKGGEHVLKVAFKDGAEVETKFTIAKSEEAKTTTITNPKTGDNIIVYVVIAIISILGLATTIIVRKKIIK